jgi:hypothetical protein
MSWPTTHNCLAKCRKCRGKFAVCRGDRHIPMFRRPDSDWSYCEACACAQIEAWLNGAIQTAPCPYCWAISCDEGKAFIDGGQRIQCLHCASSWPALGVAGTPSVPVGRDYIAQFGMHEGHFDIRRPRGAKRQPAEAVR